MKIAVLHQDLEWPEPWLRDCLRARGHACELVALAGAKPACLAGVDLVVNRVYASVANRAWADNQRTLALLDALEQAGVRCVNSARASRADYDKHGAARSMAEAGVATPPTRLLRDWPDYRRQADAIRAWGYPLVVKPNAGGRAWNIHRAIDETALLAWLGLAFDNGGLGQYRGGLIVQPCLASLRPYDIRIAVLAGAYAYAYRRSLVPTRPGDAPWLGSVSSGSEVGEYRPDPAEIDLALRASAAIGAEVNEVDLLVTTAGPVVIENNPTPGFIAGDGPLIEQLAESLLA